MKLQTHSSGGENVRGANKSSISMSKFTNDVKTGVVMVFYAGTLAACSPSLPELEEKINNLSSQITTKIDGLEYVNTLYEGLQDRTEEIRAATNPANQGKYLQKNEGELKESILKITSDIKHINSRLNRLEKYGRKFVQAGGEIIPKSSTALMDSHLTPAEEAGIYPDFDIHIKHAKQRLDVVKPEKVQSQ